MSRIDYKAKLMDAMKNLKEIKDDADNIGAELSKLDIAEQDVLHIIENLSFNASQGFYLAKKLKDIREERRELKFRLEQAKEMRAILDVYKDRLIDRTEKAIEKMDNLNKIQGSRVYKIRSLSELEPLNQLGNKQRGLK